MPENDGDRNVDQQRGRERATVGVPPDEPSSKQTQSGTDAEQTAQIQKLNRKMVITWVIASFGPLIAIAGLVFSGLQWRAAEGQLDVMRAQLNDARDGAVQARRDTDSVIAAAKAQAESMRILADANMSMARIAETNLEHSGRIARSTEATVKGSQNSFRLDQRAWIHVAGIDGLPVVDRPFTITIDFSNSGKTPAQDTRFLVRIDLTAERQPLWVTDMRGSISKGLIFPGQKISTALTVTHNKDGEPAPLTKDLLDAIDQKRITVWVIGRAAYKDIFSRKHWMTFCYYYQLGRYVICDSHNETGDTK